MAPGPDIPPLLQPGDREDAIGRILDARTPAAALLGPEEPSSSSPVERLERYRHLVNQVHPDRCADPRAAAAFERASRAFDVLCARQSLGLMAGVAEESAEWAEVRAATGALPGSRWWHAGSIADLDRLLEHRDVVMRVLLEEVVPSLDAAGLQQLRSCVMHAEHMCEHLDRSRGFARHRLWHARKGERQPSTDLEVASQARRCAARFVDLLSHLRAVHRFCHLSGCAHDHQAELEAASSASMARALIKQMVVVKASEPGITYAARDLLASQCEQDRDPLDAYMAAVEEELRTSQDTRGADAKVVAITTGKSTECGLPLTESPAHEAAVDVEPSSLQPTIQVLGSAREDQLSHTTVSGPNADFSVGPCPSLTPALVWKGAVVAGVTQGHKALAVSPVPTRPVSPWLGGGIRLATGALVPLTAASALEERQDTSKLTTERGLQDQLLADLESEESEPEEKSNGDHSKSGTPA